jgi:protein-S-isoprenylcysteine O-methyltransferase Ste14
MKDTMAKRIVVFIAGVIIYLVFLLTNLYMIGFLADLFVPKAMDDGVSSPLAIAILVDVALIAVFGVQHSLMARPAFKARWTRWIPPALERSVFVLSSSLALLFLFWQWRPLPDYIWNFPGGIVNVVLNTFFWLGWIGVVVSTLLIDHFDLFGLRQVYLYFRGKEYTHVPFKKPALYNYMRHPMMLAFLIAFWSTPQMSFGRLLFAAGMTAVILIGIAFEERDLLRAYGEPYNHYRRQVSMLLPLPRRK